MSKWRQGGDHRDQRAGLVAEPGPGAAQEQKRTEQAARACRSFPWHRLDVLSMCYVWCKFKRRSSYILQCGMVSTQIQNNVGVRRRHVRALVRSCLNGAQKLLGEGGCVILKTSVTGQFRQAGQIIMQLQQFCETEKYISSSIYFCLFWIILFVRGILLIEMWILIPGHLIPFMKPPGCMRGSLLSCSHLVNVEVTTQGVVFLSDGLESVTQSVTTSVHSCASLALPALTNTGYGTFFFFFAHVLKKGL